MTDDEPIEVQIDEILAPTSALVLTGELANLPLDVLNKVNRIGADLMFALQENKGDEPDLRPNSEINR